MNQQALQNLLVEMDNQLKLTQAELAMCSMQLDRVSTNLARGEATAAALGSACSVPDNEIVYQGVGKAFVATPVNDYLAQVDIDAKAFRDLQKSLLIKKNYLQTTLDKTLLNMSLIVGKK